MSKVVRVDSVFAFPLCFLFMYFGKIFSEYDVNSSVYIFFIETSTMFEVCQLIFSIRYRCYISNSRYLTIKPDLDDPAWLPRFVKET